MAATPKTAKTALPGDIVVAVPLQIIGIGVAGGEEHHQADGQQHQDENEQGHIQARAQAEQLIPHGAALGDALRGLLAAGAVGAPAAGNRGVRRRPRAVLPMAAITLPPFTKLQDFCF